MPAPASPADVALVRSLYERLTERVGEPDAKDLHLDDLTADERCLYVLMTLADHVQRGGFEQAFYFTAHLTADAPGAAAHLHAHAFRELFENANRIAFDEPPRKRSQSESRRMMRAVERGAEELAKLDDRFDALMAQPDSRIEAYLAARVRASPEGFGDLPTP